MKKIIFVILIFIAAGCSSRIINGKEQTFTEYVIFNRNSDWKGSSWKELNEECYPLLRLKKWNGDGVKWKKQ